MDDFAREVTKRAIAKACVALDFKYTSSTVLDIMSDVVHHYIRSIGERTREQAEVAGRSQPGIHDVLAALEQARPANVSWKELRDFVFDDVKNPSIISENKWCAPFPFVVPSFPVRLKIKKETTNLDEAIRGPHIPSHLPPYPPEHTYRRTSKKRSLEPSSLSKDQSRSKKITSIKSIRKSITLLEAVELRNLKREEEKSSESIETLQGNVTDVPVLPLLEVDHKASDMALNDIDISQGVRKDLSKEQKILLGVSDVQTAGTNT
eukprot:gene2447-4751_t